MLRSTLRTGQYAISTAVFTRFVCAFCQRVPHRYISITAPNAKEPSKSALGPKSSRKGAEKGVTEKKVKAKPKRSKKLKAKAAEKSKKEKTPAKKAKIRQVISKVESKAPMSISTAMKRSSLKADPEMSIAAAMQRKGTTVLERGKGLNVENCEIEPIEIKGQPSVANLSHGLDRVLFNPGVTFLQDPNSRVFNFDPYLKSIMPVTEFDFNATSAYITSSEDTALESIAKKTKKKYMGSTSSMTSVLSHFHYLLSAWRPINVDILSKSFAVDYKTFTQISRLPTSIFLRYKGDGTYAIDADKELDGDNVLSFLGRSMEKLLTLTPSEFEKYRRENSHTMDEEERKEREAYHYSKFGDFIMRSQLDAHDPRLPGSGMFDLKTRAVVAVRCDVSNFHLGSGYQIKTRTGTWESFEREYFDMIRAAFLKYSLQVRMGNMDGIFVAFHNTEKIFGFQYISLNEMDAALHEGPGSGIGDQEFKLSLKLFNKLLNRATTRFPEKSLRVYVETRESQSSPYMYFFAEPMEDEKIDELQRGERGSLEEFMSSLKEKLELAQKSKDGISLDEPEENDPTVQEMEQENCSSIDQEGIMQTEEESLEADEKSEVIGLEETKTTTDTEQEAVETDTERDIEKEIDSDKIDEEFLNELHAQAVQDNSNENLLGMTLTIKNYVNGKEVLRPTLLTPKEKWEVEYSIAQIATQSRTWAVYNAVRLRKQNSIRKRLTMDSEQLGPYAKYIYTLAEEGRQWEREQNLLDANRETVVFKSMSKGS